MKEHHYQTTTRWVGNLGAGTRDYKAYSRNHDILFPGKAVLPGSSDPAFRGDPARYNPEELLVSSLSTCHMLWYLHLCAVNGIVVIDYVDEASGVMSEDASTGAGRFVSVTLRPRVTASSGDRSKALELHHQAHAYCFIANSVNFPVTVEAAFEIAD